MAFRFLKNSRRRIALFFALFLIALLWFYQKYAKIKIEENVDVMVPSHMLLWWTRSPAKQELINCGNYVCTLTCDRRFLSQAEVVMFYGSLINMFDMPLPRRKWQLWGLLHEESPRNFAPILHNSVQNHFNFSSTFSRYSDNPLTTSYLPNLQDLTSHDYVVPIGQKSKLRWNLAPVLYIQSDCFTMTSRDDYVSELMKYISVDSYGNCLHNRDLPRNLNENYLLKLYSADFLNIIAQYKFVISIENGVCYDYITEKFWRPLMLGCIPIYYGSPTIRDWEPNNQSVIYITDFATPKDLATYLLALDQNDTAYNKYLKHKYDMIEPISNIRLRDELLRREGEMEFFDDFQCCMCRAVHSLRPGDIHKVNMKHYHCPLPCNNTEFNKIQSLGKCEANVLDILLQKNVNYTQETFDTLLQNLVAANECNDYSFE